MQYLLNTASLCLFITVILTSCGGGSGGSGGPTGGTGESPDAVTISGKLTFDRVPHSTFDSSLDYSAVQVLPIRAVVVEALDSSGAVLATATSDEAGNYALSVAAETRVRIRVKAQLLTTGTPSWDFRVTDNTSGNALYVLDGQLLSSGGDDSTRDLHAPSGWSGSRYGNTRAAAPFAILDSVYNALQLVLSVQPQAQFPAAELRWSVNNRPVENNIDTGVGDLPTSFYRSSEGNIYLLGAEDIDTDEYDGHLIIHEWGHYFEDRFSRTDSVGGSHSPGERLDMRVAFGEGWGNAFSGMASGDPIYRDALGNQQGSGFSFSVETNRFFNKGWFNEASVQTILYDIFDAESDGVDTISLGFAPIYDALVSSSYRQQSSFTSIYSFIEVLLDGQPAEVDGIEALLAEELIDGAGSYGEGESNGPSIALPVYLTVEPGGAAVRACSNQAVIGEGEYNKLENRRFFRVTLSSAGTYTFLAQRAEGMITSDPDMRIYRAGSLQGVAESGDINREEQSFSLAAGNYVFELAEFSNIDEDENTGGYVCFDVRVFRR